MAKATISLLDLDELVGLYRNADAHLMAARTDAEALPWVSIKCGIEGEIRSRGHAIYWAKGDGWRAL